MSLTSTLLLRLPITLPKGRKRLISNDKQNESARNTITRLSNVEAVFNAIAEGHDTIIAIEDAAGLSPCTVKRALNELEDWPGGARIQRIKGRGRQPQHHFKTIPI